MLYKEWFKIDGIKWLRGNSYVGTGNYKNSFVKEGPYVLRTGENHVLQAFIYPSSSSQNAYSLSYFRYNAKIPATDKISVNGIECATIMGGAGGFNLDNPQNWSCYTLEHGTPLQEMLDGKHVTTIGASSAPKYRRGYNQFYLKVNDVLDESIKGIPVEGSFYLNWAGGSSLYYKPWFIFEPKGGDYTVTYKNTNTGAIIEEDTSRGYKQIFVKPTNWAVIKDKTYSAGFDVAINDADVTEFFCCQYNFSTTLFNTQTVSVNGKTGESKSIGFTQGLTQAYLDIYFYEPSLIHFFIGKRADGTYTNPLEIRYSYTTRGENLSGPAPLLANAN